jgi:hypothetical protein
MFGQCDAVRQGRAHQALEMGLSVAAGGFPAPPFRNRYA